MDLITTKEAAAIWGITIRRVQVLCDNRRIPDAAFKLGDIWVIPKGTPKPLDSRTKVARAILQEIKR